jgi:hypothetical protein
MMADTNPRVAKRAKREVLPTTDEQKNLLHVDSLMRSNLLEVQTKEQVSGDFSFLFEMWSVLLL